MHQHSGSLQQQFADQRAMSDAATMSGAGGGAGGHDQEQWAAHYHQSSFHRYLGDSTGVVEDVEDAPLQRRSQEETSQRHHPHHYQSQQEVSQQHHEQRRRHMG